MKRFLVRPGYVVSANDDEFHWISARQIMDLNHVRSEECVVIDRRRPETVLGLTDEYISTLLELTPMTYWYSPVGSVERRAYPIGGRS